MLVATVPKTSLIKDETKMGKAAFVPAFLTKHSSQSIPPGVRSYSVLFLAWWRAVLPGKGWVLPSPDPKLLGGVTNPPVARALASPAR